MELFQENNELYYRNKEYWVDNPFWEEDVKGICMFSVPSYI